MLVYVYMLNADIYFDFLYAEKVCAMCLVFGFSEFVISLSDVCKSNFTSVVAVCVRSPTTSPHNAKRTILTFDLKKSSLYDMIRSGASSGNGMCCAQCLTALCARPGWIKVCQSLLFSSFPAFCSCQKMFINFWLTQNFRRPSFYLSTWIPCIHVCHKTVHFDLHAMLLSEIFNIYGKTQMEYVITISYLWCQRFERDFHKMPDTETDERTHTHILTHTQSTFPDSSLMIKIKCCENAERSDYILTAAFVVIFLAFYLGNVV